MEMRDCKVAIYLKDKQTNLRAMETQSSYSFHLFFKQSKPLRWCLFSLLRHLDLQLALVVHRVRPMLLVLSAWRLAGYDLHLHSSWQKELCLLVL